MCSSVGDSWDSLSVERRAARGPRQSRSATPRRQRDWDAVGSMWTALVEADSDRPVCGGEHCKGHALIRIVTHSSSALLSAQYGVAAAE
ncbi:hypothetical protein CKAH01_01051 [Colletotrichum kahawae]|uniref:Uncharacterized protein n=1 Tax=Colletotrichum kahawae TaxID=34407 RepID=A0AAD9YAC6_COLKA|nr:hypothetical protein CKAH01_01051 [Colletotrichum kahawae]